MSKKRDANPGGGPGREKGHRPPNRPNTNPGWRRNADTAKLTPVPENIRQTDRDYQIIQIGYKHCVACPTPAGTAPLIISLFFSTNNLIDWGDFIPQPLAIGDCFKLKTYELLTNQGKLLPLQETFEDLQAAYAKDENRVIANAKALKLRMTSLVKREQRPAITDTVQLRRRGGQVGAQVFVDGESISLAVREPRIDGATRMAEGCCVSAWVGVIPEDMVKGVHYALPHSYPEFKAAPKIGNRAPRVLILNIGPIRPFPLDPVTGNLTQKAVTARLREHKDWLALVASVVQMRSCRENERAGGKALLTPTDTPWEYQVSLAKPEPKNLRFRMKQWKKNILVQIGKFEGLPISTAWETSDLKISTEPENEGAITLRIRLEDPDSQRRVKRLLPQLFKHAQCPPEPDYESLVLEEDVEEELLTDEQLLATPTREELEMMTADTANLNLNLWIQPSTLHTGQEHVIKVFKGSGILESFMRQDTRAKILKALFGNGTKVAGERDVQGNLPTLSALNEGQKKAAEAFILSDEPVHYVQAPAGTDKTRMIAATVGCLHSQPRTSAKGIVITATTNNSVLNVLQALMKESLSTAKILFIQSDLEDRRTREDERRPEDIYKVVEYARQLADSPLVKGPERQLLQRYVDAKEAGIRSMLEADAVSLVIRLCRPDIIVATMGMVQAHCKTISPRANYLLIDEAGQMSVAQCAALVATYAKLEKLLITGDIYQLPAYNHRLKGDVLSGGLESVITAVNRRQTVPSKTLSVAYRAHPALTELQSALYNGQLVSALKPEDRSLLASVAWPLPNPSIPLVVIDTPCDHQVASWGSRCNKQQEQRAFELATALRKALPLTKITVLCYYTAAKMILEEKMASLDVRVTTVDGFQGREEDVIIVVTTRTSSIAEEGGIVCASGPSDDDFLLSDERAVVSLTCAREGLFILGEVNFLMAGEKWATFLRQAAARTHFVTEDYAKQLAEAGRVNCARIKAFTSLSSFQKEPEDMEC
ncbi:hypothetical protein QR680_006259 [Steinernema hermaphroditum]|uniref:DNA2/NAM7 helicase-like C-terminal domain-containing protein n=1 Tax=Steinernema hermaphroditum TaxID=289476 RepID=A0AA39LWU3_9BILA|nr:hypothetical protein QR680_006259 [Steinernema hermaphroditum]